MSKRGMAGPFACTVAVLASRNATMSSKAMTSKYFVRFIGNYTTRGLIMDIASQSYLWAPLQQLDYGIGGMSYHRVGHDSA